MRLKHFFTGLLVAAAVLACSACKSGAQELKQMNWTGPYIGIGAGYQMGATKADLSVPATSIVGVDGLSSQGCTLSVQGGYDYKFGSSPLLVGVFGQYNPKAGCDASFSASLFGTDVLTASIDNEWRIGGRVGMVTTGNMLLYAGAFYAHGDLNWTLGSGPGAKAGSAGMGGKGLLLGLELPLNPVLSLAVEASWTGYDSVGYSVGGSGHLGLDTNTQGVIAKLNFHPASLF